jgi:tetratricopeptide (TPR) repeat protein
MKFNLYSDRSKLYERLLQLKADGLNRYYASSNYFDMGRCGIFSGKYSEALDATLRGIELYPANELLLTNLPLCYIFTEQTEKAKSVYLEYKDKPFTEDAQYNSFKEVFLADIADLESKGLIHPYFEKVKDLLKK